MTALVSVFVGIAALIGGGLLWARRRLVAVTVTGRSMEPALYPGERVLVRRVRAGAVRVGQVVVTAWPHDDPQRPPGEQWMIKRVAAVVPPDRLMLLGDHTQLSRDSRELGSFPARDLLGVVLTRLPTTDPAATPVTAVDSPDTGATIVGGQRAERSRKAG